MTGPLDPQTPSDVSTPEGQRVTAALARWKRKLLDLSKRNRALNFRPYKVSTVAIVDEQPAEVFRQLYLLERSLRFKPAPEPAKGTPRETATEIAEPDELEVQGSSLDFTAYDASRLDPRHTDDVLQTASPLEQLQKSLRRLEEQARSAIEEQGVNPLFLALGMLHYKREKEEDVLRAPLVLVPVTLGRRSVEAGYTLHAADDDPIVNPALAEYLRQRGIVLPELPDLTDIAADYDLQTLFGAASAAIAEQAGWTLKTDVFLGLFSFQKFVIYKDLEANGPSFASHRLIRRLVTRGGPKSMETVVGLPGEVRELDLDAGFPPEATAQVVDADSSQLRAMAAVQREHDMVLEGPPGTGKSQTITNLIAQALAAGKSVLFVAEKMAALQVVHGRLVGAGLGEFCLELHSSRANKRTVMRELASALDASLQRPQMPEPSGPRLQTVRRELDGYVEAVHTPWGALGYTPYRAYGELGQVLNAPKLRLTAPVAQVTREQLTDAARDLRSLAELARDVDDPTAHPWRETTRTFYSEDDLDNLATLLADLAARLEALLQRADEVHQAFALPPVRTFAGTETAAVIAAALGRSPGVSLEILRSDGWNAPPPQALEIAARGRRVAQLRERLGGRLAPEALERDHADDATYIERKEAGALRFLNVLSGRFREIRRRWTGWRRPGWQPTLIEQAAEMRQVDALRHERQALTGEDPAARQLFGALWQGEASSWDALDAYIRWVVEVRALALQHRLDERALEIAARPQPDLSTVEALRREAAEAAGRLAGLRTAVGWPADHLAASPFGEIMERVQAMADHLRLAPRWAAFESVRARAAAGPGAEVVAAALRGEVPFPDLAAAFLRAFYQRWLSAVVQEREPLRAFHALAHEQRVEEFRRLDQQVLQENRARLVRELRDRTQKRLQSPEALAGMPTLKREMVKQRALAPLRKTLRNAETAIRSIKPCFMMSPLTVAQLLDGKAPNFDLVVFDEASQLPAEDAVGAIVRGRQLVVVGDPKQLPPTDFF
ncbi:MAG TPA: DUF4011 domain-containing protein, partial [Thermoanaerobaculia bacterium]|nr:DUF4011 domain-containing protein [Thermoanaerobaculia bacterium]